MSFHLQLSVLQDWFAESLVLDSFSKTATDDLYERYSLDIQSTGTLGVKRKVFAKEIRSYFAKDVQKSKVKFVYKDRPFVEGDTKTKFL